MPEMPKPNQEHLRLHRLVGTWEGPEHLSPSPFGPGGEAVGRTVFRPGPEGFTVVGAYQETKGDEVVFRGLSIFAVDAPTSDVLWYWFDSMGVPQTSAWRGRWDGDRLVIRSEFPQGFGRYTYELDGADRYRFTLEVSGDGKTWTTSMQGDYRRVG
jgi:hypothetical protein